jgi:hypothetical protein
MTHYGPNNKQVEGEQMEKYIHAKPNLSKRETA